MMWRRLFHFALLVDLGHWNTSSCDAFTWKPKRVIIFGDQFEQLMHTLYSHFGQFHENGVGGPFIALAYICWSVHSDSSVCELLSSACSHLQPENPQAEHNGILPSLQVLLVQCICVTISVFILVLWGWLLTLCFLEKLDEWSLVARVHAHCKVIWNNANFDNAAKQQLSDLLLAWCSCFSIFFSSYLRHSCILNYFVFANEQGWECSATIWTCVSKLCPTIFWACLSEVSTFKFPTLKRKDFELALLLLWNMQLYYLAVMPFACSFPLNARWSWWSDCRISQICLLFETCDLNLSVTLRNNVGPHCCQSAVYV